MSTISRDISALKAAEARILHDMQEKERLLTDLQTALANVKTLRGLVPICGFCKKIRDDRGYWNQIESYVQKHTSARFSHGLCPDCLKEHYSEYMGDDAKSA